MKIEDFGVEMWMNAWETKCAWNVAETCVESVTVEELLALAGIAPEEMTKELLQKKLTYGWIEGSGKVRSLIAGLYQKMTPENIVTTHGAIGANMLVHKTLVEPGDHVISVIPTYQQHYSIPASIGGRDGDAPSSSGRRLSARCEASQENASSRHEAHLHQQSQQPDGRADGREAPSRGLRSGGVGRSLGALR